MIVKKCPAYYEGLGCMSNKICYTKCENDTDCIIKYILREYPQLKESLEAED